MPTKYRLFHPWQREPVAIVNAVRLVLLAAITFGLSLTDAQLVASMAALEAVLTLFTRQQVTPTGDADDRGVTVLEAAAISFLVCLVVLLVLL
jgi:hypothetical protein